MKGRNWLEDQPRTFVLFNAAPGASALLLSVGAHFVALVLLIVGLRHTAAIRILPVEYQTPQRNPGTAYLSLSAKPTRQYSPIHAARRKQPAKVAEPGSAQQGTSAAQVLRAEARKATAAITASINFHGIYGFYPDHEYQLAVQTAGEFPSISATQVPPRFEQYVVIEVTIDTEGKVAEARIVAGLVDEAIQQTLLSAIREFKYNPAKRDGVPIPSQRDIVIHIPT
jgi:TonB family protein